METNTDYLLYTEAESFIKQCYKELHKENLIADRLTEIKKEIKNTGFYTHTSEELHFGACLAWRNSNRCIGRLFWNKLHILDARNASTESEVLDALLHHIEYATNNGAIKPTITIFKPYKNPYNQIKIYNHQLIRYAGYEADMGIIGDSSSVDFTKYCEQLGWKSKKTAFDVLPLVFSIDGKNPVIYDIPTSYVKEIQISHPSYSFMQLDLKWYAVPMISDMTLEIGGIMYTAAPFNGWYMATEIGARNLGDDYRYNILPKVAEIMKLDTTTNRSLWKDKALIELNIAILHSFKMAGVSIVDHHTAAMQFQEFEKRETASGRLVTGNWVWLIPPVSPSATHIFHKPYDNSILKPNFFHRKNEERQE